jgi:integrase
MAVREDIIARTVRFLRGGYTLREVKEMWAEQHYPGLSKGAVNAYEVAFNYAVEYHDWVFREIKYRQWQGVINKIRANGLHYSTQKKFKNLCGQLCDFAIKNEFAEYNYAKMLQLDRNRPVNIKTPFSIQEIRRLWRNVGRIANVDLVLILIYTGLRISEFLRVNMSRDVFIEDRYFIVRESKTEAGRNRVVPIHNDIIPFFKCRAKFDKLATTKKGDYFTTYTNFRKEYAKILEQLNMDHTIHETRHTCATLLDSVDANPNATKRILGHAGTNVTDAVYIHKQVSDLLAAMDKVPGKDI